MEKLVILKVMSLEGHSEFSLTPQAAIDEIKKLYNDEKKWVYIDGSVVHPNRLTQEMLLGAKEILASNAVVGGVLLFSDAPEYKNNLDEEGEELDPEEDPEIEEAGEGSLDNDEDYTQDVNGKLIDTLEVDLSLDFEDIAGSSNRKIIAAFELTEATKDSPVALKLIVDKGSVAQTSHLRKFMFVGGLEQVEDFLEGELNKFKQIYNID